MLIVTCLSQFTKPGLSVAEAPGCQGAPMPKDDQAGWRAGPASRQGAPGAPGTSGGPQAPGAGTISRAAGQQARPAGQAPQGPGPAPYGMFAISLDAGRPGSYLMTDDAYCALTGYSRQELAGGSFLGDLHPEDQAGMETLIGGIMAGEASHFQVESRLVRKDGEVACVRLTGSAMQPAAGGRYLAVFAADTAAAGEAQADLHRLEGELQRVRRLASLGHLAEGITHDFSNILTVIANFASLVREEVSIAEATDSATRWAPVRWDMQQIEDATDRAKRLIKELQAFTRREVAEPRTVDTGQLISDVTALLRELLGEHIPIAVRPGDGLWPVEIDRGLIEQAIINIALNARDAMPSGGQLTIEAANAGTPDPAVPAQAGTGLPDLPPGHYVQIRVTDTGRGMDAATAARAFEPFFTTKPADGAAGLGLPTVGRIAAQAGGKAWLRSQPGSGTTVAIILPAAPGSAAAPDATGRAGQAGAAAGSILVVDDEQAICAVAHRVLTSAGYHVTTASGGEQALSLLGNPETAADLIIADVVMPGITGPEFAARAQALRPGIRVLYMSGYERLGLPADDWPQAHELIAKPFSRASLLATVSHALMASPAHP